MTELDNLISTYNNLISKDHHKDRDCHFYIQKVWSYGELRNWRVSHYGYCHREGQEGVSKFFSTYQEAEQHLENLLTTWIADEQASESTD